MIVKNPVFVNGVVVLSTGERISVKYRYVSDDEIQCIREDGTMFYTHYKSLIMA